MRIEEPHRALLQRLQEGATLTHDPAEGWSLNLHDGLLPLAVRARDTLFLREIGMIERHGLENAKTRYRITAAGKEAIG